MRMMPRAAHRACGWGARSNCQKFYTAGLVGAKITIPDLWRLSSMCFLLLNSLLFSWLLRWSDLFAFFFVRVASRRLRSALVSALDYAKYVRCEGPSRAVLPVLHRQETSPQLRPPSTSSCYARFSDARFPSVSAN